MKTLNGAYTTREKNLLHNAVHDLRPSWTDSKTIEQIYDTVLAIHNDVGPQYIYECSLELEKFSPTILGFTCMFDQIGPSLTLAAHYKAKHPDVTVVLGGYAVSGVAGRSLLAIDFVDYVFDGESEMRFPAWCKAVDANNVSQARGLSQATSFVDINKSPTPVFDDYFRDLAQLFAAEGIKIRPSFLPLDSSRGCWWGQKHHCAFCGIRSGEMPFRYKHVSRFKEQVCEIRDAYGYRNVRISDYILPRQYNTPEAVEILKEAECNFSSEMKSNLKRIDTQRLRQAGFIDVQIGVESFCDRTLRNISKGVTSLQNIQAIRFLNEEGISVAYNIIHGFSDDEEAHFEELALNLWRLYHLSPPASFVRLAYTADSPICTKLQEEGAVNVHPFYDLVYPIDREWSRNCNKREIAYYFDGNRPEESNAIRRFRSGVREWRRAHARGALLEVCKS